MQFDSLPASCRSVGCQALALAMTRAIAVVLRRSAQDFDPDLSLRIIKFSPLHFPYCRLMDIAVGNGGGSSSRGCFDMC